MHDDSPEWLKIQLKSKPPLCIMTVTDNDLIKHETARQQRSTVMQSFIFDRSKQESGNPSDCNVNIEIKHKNNNKKHKKENKRNMENEDKEQQKKVSLSTVSNEKKTENKEANVTEAQSKYKLMF